MATTARSLSSIGALIPVIPHIPGIAVVVIVVVAIGIFLAIVPAAVDGTVAPLVDTTTAAEFLPFFVVVVVVVVVVVAVAKDCSRSARAALASFTSSNASFIWARARVKSQASSRVKIEKTEISDSIRTSDTSHQTIDTTSHTSDIRQQTSYTIRRTRVDRRRIQTAQPATVIEYNRNSNQPIIVSRGYIL